MIRFYPTSVFLSVCVPIYIGLFPPIPAFKWTRSIIWHHVHISMNNGILSIAIDRRLVRESQQKLIIQKLSLPNDDAFKFMKNISKSNLIDFQQMAQSDTLWEVHFRYNNLQVYLLGYCLTLPSVSHMNIYLIPHLTHFNGLRAYKLSAQKHSYTDSTRKITSGS